MRHIFTLARGVMSAWVALLLAAAPAVAQPAARAAAKPAATAAAPAVAVQRVDAVGMTVSDMDRSVEFYTTVLGFQHVAIIVSDMDRAYARLRRHRVRHASPGPQRLPDWNPNAGGIEAFYFKDPDDHVLEILEFPPGKGLPKWHRPGDRLFLGIDHTAVVVRDTEASLAFYRDLLGLTVAGESENHGEEQERLNNVFGARLRITALRAAGGPGIELLEYLAPRDGRPYPEDARANDLLHWQTTLVAADADGAERALRRARARFVSPGVVALAAPQLGFRRGVLVRDPDGHAMEVVEK